MAVAVALSAFGAHALSGRLSTEELGFFELANRYLVWHALPLLALSTLDTRTQKGGYFLLAGIFFFCGSLQVMAFGGPRFFGAITPIGGLCFLIGWVWLAVFASIGRTAK